VMSCFCPSTGHWI